MSEKCCNRVGVQSTHWEGCHEVHPSCAAYKAGYEAGLREAADIADSISVGYSHGLTRDEFEAIICVRNNILAAIGEKHD